MTGQTLSEIYSKLKDGLNDNEFMINLCQILNTNVPPDRIIVSFFESEPNVAGQNAVAFHLEVDNVITGSSWLRADDRTTEEVNRNAFLHLNWSRIHCFQFRCKISRCCVNESDSKIPQGWFSLISDDQGSRGMGKLYQFLHLWAIIKQKLFNMDQRLLHFSSVVKIIFGNRAKCGVPP